MVRQIMLCKDLTASLGSGSHTLVKILLQSSISTLKVEALAKIKSFAPIRE